MSLRDELMRVRSTYGSLTPENVVEDARDEASPLHHRFEWDDKVAADAYRIDQARELIRKVKVTYAAASGEQASVRAFLPVRGEDSPRSVYQPTADVMADPFMSQMVLREFDRDWRSFKSRYGALKEFRDVIAAEARAVA